jgi:hypothetical protein
MDWFRLFDVRNIVLVNYYVFFWEKSNTLRKIANKSMVYRLVAVPSTVVVLNLKLDISGLSISIWFDEWIFYLHI